MTYRNQQIGSEPTRCSVREVVVLLAFMVGCSTHLHKIDLGANVPVNARKKNVKLMVSPAAFQDEWVWRFSGIEYSLGVDDDGRVQFLGTSSRRISTPEGVRVGQSLAKLQKLEGVPVRAWAGWGYVAELSSGWKAAFFVEESMTDRKLQPDDRIGMIFRGTAAGYGAGD